MSVKIRLRRTGVKKRPNYRVVVADSTSPRDGRFIEIVGHYNPLVDPALVVVKADRIRYWLSVGARPTETVEKLLKKNGVLPADAAASSSEAASGSSADHS